MEGLSGSSDDVASQPTSEASETAAASDPLRAYRTWAWRFFAILDVVAVIGLIIVVGAWNGDTFVLATLLLSSILAIAVLTVLLRGVDRGAAWAVHAIELACVVIIVFGLLRAVLALAHGSIDIPLEVIGAVLVLSRAHPQGAMPPLSRPGWRKAKVMIGAMLVAQLAPYALGPIGTGGILAARPADLALTVDVRCEDVVPHGPLPVSVNWSWTRGELLPPSTDGMLVQWHVSTNGSGDPGSGLIVQHDPVTSDPRIWPGSDGATETALRSHAGEMQGIEIGIDHQRGLLSGRVDLELLPADPTATAGAVEAWIWYAHGQRWTWQSPIVDCQWGTVG